MVLHTQVTRLLGPLHSWAQAFEQIAAGGYNSVYLTPVQRISHASGSAFCIADQLQLGLSLFEGSEAAASHHGALDELRAVIDSCNAKVNMTFVTDVVLNHMALDAPFLLQHPECAYNLNNSPHLRAPAMLDAALHSFSQRVLDGEFVSSGLVPVVRGTAVLLNLQNDEQISAFVDVFFTQARDMICAAAYPLSLIFCCCSGCSRHPPPPALRRRRRQAFSASRQTWGFDNKRRTQLCQRARAVPEHPRTAN
jgi:hypothetical protein